MGYAKKQINPKIVNHVNRNFTTFFIKAVVKAVDQPPSPWKPNKQGGKGHAPKKVAIVCILRVGFHPVPVIELKHTSKIVKP
jgi:hypothetical protein